MAYYNTQFVYTLTPMGGSAFFTGSVDEVSSYLNTGADEYFNAGDIVLQHVDGIYSSTEEYVGHYGDGIITSYIYKDGDDYTETGYYFYSNTDYSNMYITSNGSDFLACFLEGAQVMTPSGPRRVETLTSADQLLTADGRAIPVKWVGRQSVATLFVRGDDRAPICIDAGALGPNLPIQDLKLTADHALLLDGVLVQAGALVNGSTIRKMSRAETGDRYTVFHIETEGHEVILAEGCAAETFVDNVTRRRFDNYAEYQALFGEEAGSIPEIELPRVKSARQLPASLRDLIAIRRAA